MAERWGLLLLDKPEGITSHTAMQRAGRALGALRSGHAGTLDPLASGVLLVGVGKATRLLEYLVGCDKTYRARIRLGEVRDTLDREGQAMENRPVPNFCWTELEAVLARFIGSTRQVPPAHSAIKKDGEPLYRKARRGEPVTAEPRTVEIHHIELIDVDLPDLTIEVTCSKGTYIRSLARDLGDALGTGGTLWDLVRTRSGPFLIEDSVSLQTVEDEGPQAWSRVLPADRMVEGLARVVVDTSRASMLASGRGIPWQVESSPPGPFAVFRETGEFLAVAAAGEGELRPQKVFEG